MTENYGSTSACAAPALELVKDDTTVRKDAILAELQSLNTARAALDERITVLYEQFQALQGMPIQDPQEKHDKRKDFNPIRNLKLSAYRAYKWALVQSLPLETVKQKAFAAILKAAKKFRSHPHVEPWLATGILPEILVSYVEIELPKKLSTPVDTVKIDVVG